MTVRQALKFTNYRSALFTNFTIGWAVLGIQSSLIPLLAAYLATGGDASRAPEGTVLASTVMAVGSLANALTQTVSGRLSDNLGRRIMIFIGLLIAGTAISTIGISPAPWMLVALIVGMGAGAALITPSLQASVADVIGSKRDGAPVLATFQMHSDFGMILGPLLAGAVADTWGFTPAFMLCGGLPWQLHSPGYRSVLHTGPANWRIRTIPEGRGTFTKYCGLRTSSSILSPQYFILRLENVRAARAAHPYFVRLQSKHRCASKRRKGFVQSASYVFGGLPR